ncbi:unnamed protein product [Allacma fusca]|uniref:ERAP1-like C-terminal domain-containing protein n=1 Tax=Allacma fusca TaxID=39272 RepID=A0A8J2J9R7_9HEXA|nr:unnamed protein product [Allacma fusca]
MTFATAGYSDQETALRLTKFLGTETDLVVWQTALDHFRQIYDKFSDNVDDVVLLKNYILPKINSALDLIKFSHPEGEKGTNVTLRALLLNWACSFEDSRCVDFAQEKFQEWLDQNGYLPTTIPGDYQQLIYCTAVAIPKVGTTPSDFILGKYKAEINSVHKTRLLSSLSCLKEDAKLQILLKDITNPGNDFVEADRTSFLKNLANSINERRITLEFLMNNFEGNDFVTSQIMATFFTALSSSVLGDETVAEIEAFISKHAAALAPVSATLDTAIAQMKLQNEWYTSGGARILDWFRTN